MANEAKANEITHASTLATKAVKLLDTMRSRATRANEARTDTAYKAQAKKVVEAAKEAAAANSEAAQAWDELATHAAEQADLCRHGAELADRTRRRWER